MTNKKIRRYNAYLINLKNGTARDSIVWAFSSEQARKLTEELIMGKNEKLMTIFPLGIA